MLDNNKKLFRILIILNIFFLILSIFWLFNKINLSFGRIKSPVTQAQPQPKKRYTYQTQYYFSQMAQFQNLPTSKEDIILLGDSLTDQGKWDELLKNIHVKNRGISGDTTDGVLNRLDQIVAGQPKKIFILIGANDFWQEKKPIADVLLNYKLILDTFRQKLPNTKVYVQSLLPVNNTNFDMPLDNSMLYEFNQQLEQLVKDYPVQYINLYPHFINKENQLDLQYTSDGVHLSVLGYLVWKNQIEKYINE